MSDPREEKLPLWAQVIITQERRRADKAEAKLAAHLTTVEPSPIWHGQYDNPIYVPVDYGYQTVYFSLTGQPTKHSYEEIGVQHRKGEIQIQGGRALAIEPVASNVVTIRPRD